VVLPGAFPRAFREAGVLFWGDAIDVFGPGGVGGAADDPGWRQWEVVLPAEGEGLGTIDVDADEVGLGGIDPNRLEAGVVYRGDLVGGVTLVLPALASDGCLVAVAGDEASSLEERELVCPPVVAPPPRADGPSRRSPHPLGVAPGV